MIKTFVYDEKVEFSSNAYVVGKVSSSCIIIDPGSNSNSLLEYIKSHHDIVEAILLTHGHFDHIRGVKKILDTYENKIPVYISSEDSKLLLDPKLNCATRHNENVILNIPVEEISSEKEIITKSFKIKPILTPFHTCGSICYLLSDENALFSGDTLFKDSIGRNDLPTSNPKYQDESLKKLKKLSPYLVIYPGHGEKSTIKIEIENNPYLNRL